MADRRTRRQKLEAMAADPGASQGERDNARSLLAKMKPEPKSAPRASGPPRYTTTSNTNNSGDWYATFTSYTPPRGSASRPAGRVTFVPFTGAEKAWADGMHRAREDEDILFGHARTSSYETMKARLTKQTLDELRKYFDENLDLQEE